MIAVADHPCRPGHGSSRPGSATTAPLAAFAKRGYDGTVKLANAAISMVATAYTADCSGCSGVTKSGQRAGHGIVAVDPRVIPLGSQLYIPGYGHAVAGDTGGAIHGNRIDLGFNQRRRCLTIRTPQVPSSSTSVAAH